MIAAKEKWKSDETKTTGRRVVDDKKSVIILNSKESK